MSNSGKPTRTSQLMKRNEKFDSIVDSSEWHSKCCNREYRLDTRTFDYFSVNFKCILLADFFKSKFLVVEAENIMLYVHIVHIVLHCNKRGQPVLPL